jgi:CxxC-x17-CxxC domain-containing protein
MPMIPYDHDHENEVIPFAVTNFRGQARRFGIKTDDRRRHVYVIGKTGMGKTTMIENMVMADIYAGHGVGIVDPHGDYAEHVIECIPSSRINDVVYFNPSDVDYPVGFNILEAVDETHKHLIASGLMGVFKKIWPDVWSARMEHILNNCILSLLDYPGSTLLGINRLLTNKSFRARVVASIKDPVVKAFWIDEYNVWEDKFRKEAIAAIQNKVGQFLSASIIRNMLAQVKSTIDVREIMDNRKIFIMNLAKGRIGEDNSKLMGGMLITKIQLAAMERVDTPESERQDYYLYVDEFQNFATQAFANILSEARKYRLNLIVAHQYIEQLDEDYVRPAIFGNVGTIVVFRVGAKDAEFMENEFMPTFTIQDLVNLTKFEVYLKLMIDGVSSAPFSADTLPPFSVKTGNLEKVIRVSRERYAVPRAVIEEKIIRWSEPEEGETPEQESDRPKKQKPKFEAVCSRCGTHFSVGFKYDTSRPIYCEDCLELVRSGAAKTVRVPKPVAAVVPPPRVEDKPMSLNALKDAPKPNRPRLVKENKPTFSQPPKPNLPAPQVKPQAAQAMPQVKLPPPQPVPELKPEPVQPILPPPEASPRLEVGPEAIPRLEVGPEASPRLEVGPEVRHQLEVGPEASPRLEEVSPRPASPPPPLPEFEVAPPPLPPSPTSYPPPPPPPTGK